MYTIVMRRKHNVTTYDERGSVLSISERFLEETHTGLPAMTVASYRTKFPDAIVSVTQEIESDRGSMRSSRARTFSPAHGSYAPPRERREVEKKPGFDTSDYGTLVGKLARESV